VTIEKAINDLADAAYEGGGALRSVVLDLPAYAILKAELGIEGPCSEIMLRTQTGHTKVVRGALPPLGGA
jgi:hypothetical protein